MSKADDQLKEDPYKPKVYTSTKAILGCLAGMVSTVILQPLDVLKVRLQMYNQPCSTLTMVRRITICEGYTALYAGWTAGLLRQATYTTTRLACLDWLYQEYRKTLLPPNVLVPKIALLSLLRHGTRKRNERKYKKNPDLVDKLWIGLVASTAGAFAGNPSEVALIRQMIDGPRVPCASYNCGPRYKGTVHALYKIRRQEGFLGLWRGGTLTIMRSISVNAVQMSTYGQIHDMIFVRGGITNTYELHLLTSIVSSFITAALSFPVDVIKTRYQEERNGSPLKEVVKDLWKKKELNITKGFLPYYMRITLHTILTFAILEYTFKSYNDQISST